MMKYKCEKMEQKFQPGPSQSLTKVILYLLNSNFLLGNHLKLFKAIARAVGELKGKG